uniref:Glutamate--cysteine ligase n=1 Tax=Acidicaldus sp. TaxID=1872105 RepID=A0A8J4H9J2_9PROT
MSNPGEVDTTPISDRRQLIAWLEAGAKPREHWRIGTEHEKFGFYLDDLTPPPYAPGGIRAVLEGLIAQGTDGQGGWAPILDRGQPIGLRDAGGHDGASISLEPGGQLELSGGLCRDLHATAREMAQHFAEVHRAADPLGLGFAPLGFHPLATREAMPWMPKSRYAIMRRYMPRRGALGLDMMLRTCTVQVNLDYASEADMVRKLRVALALQPVATALFANSPFTEGRPNGFLSYRAHVWTDTDPDRSGMPGLFFEPDFGFERYVDWVLDVPMYFIQRGGGLVDLAGHSFREFLERGLPEQPGEQAVLGDFTDHLTTVFTDVRIKRFLEMRGADAGAPAMMLAQSALWVGLLYDDAALAAAHALVRAHPWQEFAALRPIVPRRGLAAPWAGGTVRDLAREMVAIAAQGLSARACRDENGRDESMFLAPLQEIAAGGPSPAEFWLQRAERVWHGDIARIFPEARI